MKPIGADPRASADAAAAGVITLTPALARDLIFPLYGDRTLRTGEPFTDHADGVVQVISAMRSDPDMLAAAYLFGAADALRDADEWIRHRFGSTVAMLVADLRQLMRLSEVARRTVSEGAGSTVAAAAAEAQADALRRMLLAMVNDVRVVLLRLASRVQTLRWYAATRRDGAEPIARETMALYAPLANRLGVWQLKWELEDLAFRFLEPDAYKRIARQLDEKRVERQRFIEAAIAEVHRLLASIGLQAEVAGRPKHIVSIVNKMRGKAIGFDQLYDVRALRVIVKEVSQCYQVLSLVHQRWRPIEREFDDYIARPKANGYQSLHTVVQSDDGRPLEIQIRTQEMHQFAELGVAAHWRYKEGSSRQARSAQADEARVAWLRQLLAWREEVGAEPVPGALADERTYVLTPQGRVVELPKGATAIDFAYHIHTELGHRCRGARLDGSIVPLTTPLVTGQTVEIISAKIGGPSRDWLNPALGYVHSARSRAKVRNWFNALEHEQSVSNGRLIVDRELARLGRTAVKLEDLARQLGFASVAELCVAATRDDFNSRSIEHALAAPQVAEEERMPARLGGALGAHHRPAAAGQGKVLVMGVDSLLTQLARCCRPLPPDDVVGFVTRGKGVSIHRTGCANARSLGRRQPERLIEVTWGESDATYPVDVYVLASDRSGLLRDISEVLAREKLNVIGVNTVTVRHEAQMQFTLEVADGATLKRVVVHISDIKGVISARRR